MKLTFQRSIFPCIAKIKTSKPHKQTCIYILTFMAAWWGRIKIQDVINIFVTIFRGNDYDMKLHLVAKLYIPSTIKIALCSVKSVICVLVYFEPKRALQIDVFLNFIFHNSCRKTQLSYWITMMIYNLISKTRKCQIQRGKNVSASHFWS